MKAVCIIVFSAIIFCFVTTSIFAKGRSHGFSRTPSFSGMHHAKSSGVHNVKPYFRKNGTYVSPHLSGNPRSGVHCRNNFCYQR